MNNNIDIINVVKKFQTIPFLFVGSGITRRYYNLPNWKDLLSIFATKIDKNNKYIFAKYASQAKNLTKKDNDMPMIASLIEKDFNDLWFSNTSIRNEKNAYEEAILKKTFLLLKLK